MTAAALIAFLSSVFAGLLITALMIRVAPKFGLVDLPDNRRKLHRVSLPLGGGLAVFIAVCIVLSVVLIVPNPWNLILKDEWREIRGLLVASTWIVALGIVDDRFGLRGRHKLVGQTVGALAMLASGLVIQSIGLFGFELDLGVLAIPFTLFWFLGAMNAINLLDGIDGLAATIGIILTLTLALMATMTGHLAVGIVALVFAGSLLGFLRFNLPPARIYLGDAGSMLIGLVLGVLAIQSSLKGAGTVLLAAPLAVWAIPAFDSCLAIVRRKLTGRSVFAADRGHLHHRLLQRLGSNRRVLAVVTTACLLTCEAGLLSVAYKSDLIAVRAGAAVVTAFVATGLFGRAETMLVVSRLQYAARSLVRPFCKENGAVRHTSLHLQGETDWDELSRTLIDSVDRLKLEKIVLDVNLPRAHEAYNAQWERSSDEPTESLWAVEFPLVVSDHSVGRLTIAGAVNGETTCRQIERVAEFVGPFEAELRRLTEEQLTKVTRSTSFRDSRVPREALFRDLVKSCPR